MRRLLLIAGVLSGVAATGLAQKAVVVGISPFDDDTGTEAGEKAATMLPVMFLEKAKASGFVPVIVNPGLQSGPPDLRWSAEIARAAGADAVIIGSIRVLATSKGQRPNDAVLRG